MLVSSPGVLPSVPVVVPASSVPVASSASPVPSILIPGSVSTSPVVSPLVSPVSVSSAVSISSSPLSSSAAPSASAGSSSVATRASSRPRTQVVHFNTPAFEAQRKDDAAHSARFIHYICYSGYDMPASSFLQGEPPSVFLAGAVPLSSPVEPKGYKEALHHPAWVAAMEA